MKKALLAFAFTLSVTGVSLLSATAQSVAPRAVIGNDVPKNATNCPIGPCFAPYVGAPPLGYEQFSVVVSTSLPNIPDGAVEAFIICTGQTVRWRDDGGTPTASVGMPLPVNTAFPYTGTLSTLKIIEATPTATCNVSYYK